MSVKEVLEYCKLALNDISVV